MIESFHVAANRLKPIWGFTSKHGALFNTFHNARGRQGERSTAEHEHNHDDQQNEPQPAAAPINVGAIGENRRKSICDCGKHNNTPQIEGADTRLFGPFLRKTLGLTDDYRRQSG